MSNPVAAIFASLIGKWSIERQIIDKLANLTAHVNGYATITETKPNELLYSEEVQVKWQNATEEHLASKKYRYILDGPNNDIITQYNSIFSKDSDELEYEKMYDLKFYRDDGNEKKFHAIGEFLCSKDLYKAEYDFESPRRFRLNYEAKGPAKNFVTISIFKKCI